MKVSWTKPQFTTTDKRALLTSNAACSGSSLTNTPASTATFSCMTSRINTMNQHGMVLFKLSRSLLNNNKTKQWKLSLLFINRSQLFKMINGNSRDSLKKKFIALRNTLGKCNIRWRNWVKKWKAWDNFYLWSTTRLIRRTTLDQMKVIDYSPLLVMMYMM